MSLKPCVDNRNGLHLGVSWRKQKLYERITFFHKYFFVVLRNTYNNCCIVDVMNLWSLTNLLCGVWSPWSKPDWIIFGHLLMRNETWVYNDVMFWVISNNKSHKRTATFLEEPLNSGTWPVFGTELGTPSTSSSRRS